MTSDQTLHPDFTRTELLLIAEAELVASGFRFLRISGLVVDCEGDLERHDQVIDELGRAAGERPYLLQTTPDGLIFGVQGPDAEQQMAALRRRLDDMNPAGSDGGRRWTIRDSAR